MTLMTVVSSKKELSEQRGSTNVIYTSCLIFLVSLNMFFCFLYFLFCLTSSSLFSAFVSSPLASSHHALLCLASSNFIGSGLISSHHVFSYHVSSHHVSSHRVSSHLVSPFLSLYASLHHYHFIWSYLVSSLLFSSLLATCHLSYVVSFLLSFYC